MKIASKFTISLPAEKTPYSTKYK